MLNPSPKQSLGLWWDNVLSSIWGTTKQAVDTTGQTARAEVLGSLWRIAAVGALVAVGVVVYREARKR